MDAAEQVLEAAQARAAALASADGPGLTRLLHDDFRWTSHTGEAYDRAQYVERNTGGQTVWVSQTLDAAHAVVVDDTAVLHTVVTDVISRDGDELTFRMPVTLVWVRRAGGWRCLAGHAGPRLG